MRVAAQARTIFVGFGVSGSLLAAVGAAFIVAGGVLSFEGWPSLAAAPPERPLAVPAAAVPRGAPARRVAALPAARPAAPAPAVTHAVEVPHGTPRLGRPRGGSRPLVRRPTPAAPPLAPPGATPGPGGPPGGGGSVLARTVVATSGATAATVRSVGTVVPAAAPVTDLAGAGVQDSGARLSDLLGGSRL